VTFFTNENDAAVQQTYIPFTCHAYQVVIMHFNKSKTGTCTHVWVYWSMDNVTTMHDATKNMQTCNKNSNKLTILRW